MDVVLQPVPVADIIRAAMSLVAPQALSHDIILAPSDIAAGVDCLQADPMRLKQVLVNLLSNAVKYNVSKGGVRVWVQAASHDRVAITMGDSDNY